MIYFNTLTQKWCRRCNHCNVELSYYQKSHVNESERKDRKCSSCSHIGKTASLKTKEKMSICRRGKKHPFYGKHHTENSKKKIGEYFKGKPTWMKGKKHTEESKIKNSKSCLLRPKRAHSEETKRKMRVSQLKRLEKLHIHPMEDIGAKEFFQMINRIGFNFQPRDFLKEDEVGYRADGYDESRHIWVEFDTPYHNSIRQRKKDLIRQEHIIKHFELLEKPLTGFVRIEADKNGNVLNTKCIYKGDNHGLARR